MIYSMEFRTPSWRPSSITSDGKLSRTSGIAVIWG